MAVANHYCVDCDTHYRVDPEKHAATYHDGGIFRGIENGNYNGWERKQQYRYS